MTAHELAERYRHVRARTVALCAPLSPEDCQVQSMPDASPAKWHLAHTTWFFETFVLAHAGGGRIFDPSFNLLFNSYYEAVGERVARPHRGLLTRPALEVVRAYRSDVDHRVARVLAEGDLDDDALATLELGLHHEQQHQELLLTDVKHLLGTHPLRPAYRPDLPRPRTLAPSGAPAYRHYGGGVHRIGAGDDGFAFDNERPRHETMLRPFQLATRPVSNREVLEFIAAGGYRDARLWLSDGWQAVREGGWQAPLYWQPHDGGFALYDLTGVRPVDPDEPACHLSYYEADALARFFDARLPTEAEWEVVAAAHPSEGHFADDGRLHPGASADEGMAQLFGDVWEWTASAYAPYPGFRPLAGALGEYNGKFMCSQLVLRGGSCFTPRGHVRATYRNFFPPSARWQMSGVRLARDA